jgi:hypothetical protein
MADEIQREMAAIRSQLHHEVSGVVIGASNATDWRYYARQRPWLALGIAFATGYVVVPRRARPVVLESPLPSASAVAAPETGPLRRATRLGVLGLATRLLGPLLIRAAQGYALNYVERFLAEHPPGPHPESRRAHAARAEAQPPFQA